jgi:hypothetical protein
MSHTLGARFMMRSVVVMALPALAALSSVFPCSPRKRFPGSNVFQRRSTLAADSMPSSLECDQNRRRGRNGKCDVAVV